MDKTIEEKDISEYTYDDWRYVNKLLEAVGIPKMIILNGYVYANEMDIILSKGEKIKAQ